MDKYAVYIWSAYAAVLFLLVVNFIFAYALHRRTKRKLRTGATMRSTQQ